MNWISSQLPKKAISFEAEALDKTDWPDLRNELWFWTAQALLLFLMLLRIVWFQVQTVQQKRANRPNFHHQQCFKQIEKAIRGHELDEFLFWSAQLAQRELKNPIWPQIPHDRWQLLISAYQEKEFSPEKKIQTSFEALKQHWEQIRSVIKH